MAYRKWWGLVLLLFSVAWDPFFFWQAWTYARGAAEASHPPAFEGDHILLWAVIQGSNVPVDLPP